MNILLVLGLAAQIVFSKGECGYDTFRIPALLQTPGGDLLAFAEARKDGAGDSGNIDLVVKRSGDGGATWGEMSVVWDDGDNVCGNPAPVVDAASGDIVLVMTWNDGRDPEKAIHARTSIDTRRVFVTRSSDDGRSWETPREITSEAKNPEWTWYATGPCHAFQLSKGPKKGRIVVPCNHGNFGGKTTSHVIYSDDGGRTWMIGGSPDLGNEATACEISRGRILLNMRDTRARKDISEPYRWVAVSTDGGESFAPAYKDKALVEPVCQGSIISAPGGKKVYFSNPANSSRRKDMTVKFSRNSGKTWTKACALPGEFAAYSDLCLLPGGRVAVLYETGEQTAYDTITFLIIQSKDFSKNEIQ